MCISYTKNTSIIVTTFQALVKTKVSLCKVIEMRAACSPEREVNCSCISRDDVFALLICTQNTVGQPAA